jgi:4-amino-4-deoxy-L-arabinose transferase-like glycosyltransferase
VTAATVEQSDAPRASTQTLRAGGRGSTVPAAVLVIVFVGWLLRCWPLLVHGPLGPPVGYDEGVYFAASALLARGHVIYRDFVLVHPPGLEYLAAPLSLLGRPSTAFGIARVGMTFVGALNIFLVAKLAYRTLGRWPAIVAAGLYAVQYDVVLTERSILLEPLVNAFCLGAALFWLRERDENFRGRDSSAWIAGALLGCALGVYLWAGFALIACLATARPGRWRQDVTRLLIGAAAAFTTVILPMFVLAPAAFVREVFIFHLRRAPEGALGLTARLEAVFFDPAHAAREWSHLVITVLALAGLAVVVRRGRNSRVLRFAAVWYIVTVVAFLVSESFYSHYLANLAPAAALLAAGVTREILQTNAQRDASRGRFVLGASAAALCVSLVISSAATAYNGSKSSDDLERVAAALEGRKSCVFSFEPAWTLAAERLPSVASVGPVAVDPYAAQLEAVVRADRSYPTTKAAFSDAASLQVLARPLARCGVVVLGARGREQLGRSFSSFRDNFVRVAATSKRGPDVWVRR